MRHATIPDAEAQAILSEAEQGEPEMEFKQMSFCFIGDRIHGARYRRRGAPDFISLSAVFDQASVSLQLSPADIIKLASAVLTADECAAIVGGAP